MNPRGIKIMPFSRDNTTRSPLGRITLFTALMLSSTGVTAGIDSGGGKLSKDDQNPWFLENTDRVSFCINKGEGFEVPATRLEVLVNESFAAWKAAFASNTDDYYDAGELAPHGQVRIGTQTFTADCSNPDLSFQFGTVTQEQKSYFESIQEFVGSAIRTSYDRENLRAKGFIYIAPLVGELKPNTRQLDPAAWTVADNALLRLVLLHELGHVFGVRHNDQLGEDGDETSLMSTTLPETLIRPYFVEHSRIIGAKVLENRSPIDVIQPRSKDALSGCDDDSPVWLIDRYKNLLGLDQATRCVRIEFKTFGLVKLYESAMPGDDWTLAGTLQPRSSGVDNQDLMMRVYLPENQKVFTNLPGGVVQYGSPLFGEIRTRGEFWEGLYLPRNGRSPFPVRLLVQNGNRLSSIALTSEFEFVTPISGGN